MTSSRSSAPERRARDLVRELMAAADGSRAATYQRFFKTGPGDYAEGDRFIGVTMPAIRSLVKPYLSLGTREIDALLAHPVHECRMAGLVVMTEQYARGSDRERRGIVRRYRANKDRINNWDLVDISAHKILGAHCRDHGDDHVLTTLARSKRMWDRRIAIVATFAHLRTGAIEPSLKLAEILRDDPHDLMHKAVGWVLREVGKKDRGALDRFLEKHAHRMPRTMLRYAIERHRATERAQWLAVRRV